MRIVLVAPGDSPHANAWVREFASAAHEVTVYAYPPVTQVWPGARVRRVEGGGPLSRARWLKRAILQDDPQVISLHYASVDAFALSLLGRPFVISVWGSDLLRDLAGRPAKRFLVRYALRKAALVVSPAAHMTARLLGMGVSSERIVTAQYGVDTTVFACERDVRPGPVRIVSTRALAPVYRVADLIEAAEGLAAEDVAEIRIVGDGPLARELFSLAERKGVAGMVRLTGRMEARQVREELCSADVYVSTSESDGASLSLLEAMSCELACVVTDIPANREWIDEASGIIIPVGDPAAIRDAIRRLAADPRMRTEMGREARRVVMERGELSRNMAVIRAAVEGVAK